MVRIVLGLGGLSQNLNKMLAAEARNSFIPSKDLNGNGIVSS